MLSGPPDASYSMDQFGPLHAYRTQLPENQMPAGIQPLIQEQLDPAAEKELKRLQRKRASDRAYRQKKKDEEQELKNKCQELENANQVMDQLLKTYAAQMEDKLQKEQQYLEKIAKVEAEKELAEKKCLLLTEKESQLHQKVKAMKKKYKNLGKQCIEKPKKKLKKHVMMSVSRRQFFSASSSSFPSTSLIQTKCKIEENPKRDSCFLFPRTKQSFNPYFNPPASHKSAQSWLTKLLLNSRTTWER
ncbi:hypothetical protein SLEP1_g59021 [Rubroshorea leprosula]|nr:hypothetical protein SLEP1_g59021 [Rubroshorea leprosula]